MTESTYMGFIYFGVILAIIIGFCLGRITAGQMPMPEFKLPKVKAKDDELSHSEDPFFDAMQPQPSKRIPTVE